MGQIEKRVEDGGGFDGGSNWEREREREKGQWLWKRAKRREAFEMRERKKEISYRKMRERRDEREQKLK